MKSCFRTPFASQQSSELSWAQQQAPQFKSPHAESSKAFCLVSLFLTAVSMLHNLPSLCVLLFFVFPKPDESTLVLLRELHLSFAISAWLSLARNCSRSSKFHRRFLFSIVALDTWPELLRASLVCSKDSPLRSETLERGAPSRLDRSTQSRRNSPFRKHHSRTKYR